jgi:hypothetical protein
MPEYDDREGSRRIRIRRWILRKAHSVTTIPLLTVPLMVQVGKFQPLTSTTSLCDSDSFHNWQLQGLAILTEETHAWVHRGPTHVHNPFVREQSHSVYSLLYMATCGVIYAMVFHGWHPGRLQMLGPVFHMMSNVGSRISILRILHLLGSLKAVRWDSSRNIIACCREACYSLQCMNCYETKASLLRSCHGSRDI